MFVHSLPQVGRSLECKVNIELFARLQEDGVQQGQLGVVDAGEEVVQGVVTEGDDHEEQRARDLNSEIVKKFIRNELVY